jgi:hypothetical protein
MTTHGKRREEKAGNPFLSVKKLCKYEMFPNFFNRPYASLDFHNRQLSGRVT